jgi:DNA-binding SARP family transcriptional activator/tetratricopeptide (TPR) repeat protein
MQVRLLGPVDVLIGGQPSTAAGLRRTALLAVLSLHAGEVVSADRLIDVVWADKAGRASLNAVQSHISYLRRLFGDPAAIVARPPGYLLRLPGEPTDLVVAERLIRAGRQAPDPAHGVAALTEALSLWRGHPLEDVTEVPWLAEQADRLAALELDVRRALIDARLAAGDHTDVLPELSRLAAAHQFDEYLQAQLVTALYRTGRQADALAVLRGVRAGLAAELGIHPGPALRALEEAVLRQDAALTLSVPRPYAVIETPGRADPAPVRDRVPARDSPLAGRADELSALASLLDSRRSGGQAVALVTGDPGIGKTRLVAEFARRAEDDGCLVLWGRASEFEQQASFAPVRDVLADHLTEVSSLPGLSADDIRLLREVLPTLPGPKTDDALRRGLATERYRVYGAIRKALEVLARPAGLVVVLDDVHWADQESAQWLDHLLRHPPRGPVLILVAYRPRQISGGLSQALGRAGQDGVAKLLELAPLTFAEADNLLPVRLDEAGRRRLYDLSTGNPFYLQALARAQSLDTSSASTSGDDDVPPQVLAALAAELDTLPATAALVARAAAVAGDQPEVGIIAATADLPLAEVMDTLDVLTVCDLIRPVPRSGRFQFRHPMVRRVAYDTAGVGWRVGAHGRAAQMLREQGAPAIEQARHLERSAPRGDLGAVAVLREAAVSGLHFTPAAAAHWLGAALRLLPDQAPAAPERLRLLTMRAEALSLSGRLQDSRDTVHQALRLVPAEAVEMRAELVTTCAGLERQLRRHREATALLRSELANVADRSGRPALEMILGIVSGLVQGGIADRGGWSDAAMTAARKLGVRTLLVCALVDRVLVGQTAGEDGSLTTAYLDEAADLVDAMPDPELATRLQVAVWLAVAEGGQERIPNAMRHADRALEVARRTGQTFVVGGLHLIRGYLCTLIGDLQRATECLDEAREAVTLAGTDGPRCAVLALQSSTAARQGDLERALLLGKEALRLIGERSDFFSGIATPEVASTFLLAGDPQTAADLLAGGPASGVTTPLVRSAWWEILARAATALGRPEEASGWADLAAVEARSSPTARRDAMAESARAHALLPVDPAAAVHHALAAARLFTTAGDRSSSGRARLLAGSALAASGAPELADREFARGRALLGFSLGFSAASAPRQ